MDYKLGKIPLISLPSHSSVQSSQQFDDFMRENDLEDIRRASKPEALFDEAAADEDEMKPLPAEPKNDRPAN